MGTAPVRGGPFDAAPGDAGGSARDRLREAESDRELRAEHDALAERLAARRSIDLVRRGAYTGFAGFIAVGLAAKLAYDRWFSIRLTRFKGPPVFFFTAAAIAAVLVALAVYFLLRARRLMREEDAQFARMSELRRRLELDP
jgi:hypothetical protein